MNELQNFSFEGNGVRTLVIDNEPYFVGKDVADILGYQNGSRDINSHVDSDDRLKYQISTAGQKREQVIINESGLYSLILSSNLKAAKNFKRWVTHEVLPAIRKNGSYQDGSMTALERLRLTSESVVELDDRVSSLETNMRISGSEQYQINSFGRKKAIDVMCGKDTNAYKKCSKSVFSQLWHDFNRHFQIPRYSELPHVRYDEAKEFLAAWLPDTETRLKISSLNSQTGLFDE